MSKTCFNQPGSLGYSCWLFKGHLSGYFWLLAKHLERFLDPRNATYTFVIMSVGWVIGTLKGGKETLTLLAAIEFL